MLCKRASRLTFRASRTRVWPHTGVSCSPTAKISTQPSLVLASSRSAHFSRPQMMPAEWSRIPPTHRLPASPSKSGPWPNPRPTSTPLSKPWPRCSVVSTRAHLSRTTSCTRRLTIRSAGSNPGVPSSRPLVCLRAEFSTTRSPTQPTATTPIQWCLRTTASRPTVTRTAQFTATMCAGPFWERVESTSAPRTTLPSRGRRALAASRS